MDDRVALPDIRKELVSETLSFGRAFDKSCDIRKFKGRIDYLFRMKQFNKVIHSFIRHFDHADIRRNRRERIVFRQYLTVGDGVK